MIVIQAVEIHQATRKPKNLAYLGPALAAAQIYIDPLMGMAEQISAMTAAVIIMNTKEMIYEDLESINGTFESILIEMYQMAAGPPATKPRKMNALFVVLFSHC